MHLRHLLLQTSYSRFTRNDGSNVRLFLPNPSGGTADGVVTSGAFSANNEELILTIDNGDTVTVDVPAALRGSALTTQAVESALTIEHDEILDALVGVFTRNNGRSLRFRRILQEGGGRNADLDIDLYGVVSGAFSDDLSQLILTLIDGNTVDIAVPDALRGMATSLVRTGALPQVLSGNIDWDTVLDAGFFNVATGAVQTNAPPGIVLGAAHVFASQTYAVQIGWSFENSAETFTRTRPGPVTTPFNNWERIHIPIGDIVELLEARTGDNRLSAVALRLIADQIDTELGDNSWRTGGGGTQNYFPILDAGVGGTANAITLTTGESLTALVGGMLFFFNSTLTNTGGTTVDVDGIGTRNIQRSNFRLAGGVANTGSESLEGGEITGNDPIMLVYGSRFDEFYLLPSRAGTAAYRNVGTDALDVIALDADGNLPAVDGSQLTGLLGAFDLHDDVPDEIPNLSASDRFLVSDENVGGDPNRYVTLTSLQNALVSAAYLTNVIQLTTEDRANELIQAALAASVIGNTESGIIVTHNPDGTFDFVVRTTPPHTLFSAIRDGDNGFNVGNFTNPLTGTSSDTNEITIAMWTSGERHLAFAQPISLAEYTDMREQGSPFNARSSFDIALNQDGTENTLNLGTPLEAHRIYIFDSTLLLSASGDVWELS